MRIAGSWFEPVRRGSARPSALQLPPAGPASFATWYDGVGEHTRFPIARLRYTRATGLWAIYWRDRHLKFHADKHKRPTKSVQALLDYIETSGTVDATVTTGLRPARTRSSSGHGRPRAALVRLTAIARSISHY